MEEKKALLVVSFGTSYEETRKKTLEVIEKDLTDAFPDRMFFRAWTSGMIRKKIRERDNMNIPSIEEALDEITELGISDLLIQPTLLLAGGEYRKIETAVERYADKIGTIRIGSALLETEQDVKSLVKILAELFADRAGDGVMAFMGHGSGEQKLSVYELINQEFANAGLDNFCVGTVEFTPGIGPVLDKVRERKPKKVLLAPLLVVAGDHALNDMAGDEEDSWKNRIAAEGPEVACIVRGLGEYEPIRAMFVKKAKEIMKMQEDHQ